MSRPDFATFGDPRIFALEVALLPDPDGDAVAPEDSAGSWGEWRLHVLGQNLCAYEFGPEFSARGVRWYLAPLFRFLTHNWDPLFHEERLPSVRPAPAGVTARDAYLHAWSLFGGDVAFDPWFAWAERHSLRRWAEGGIVPDIFVRRVGDDLEFSWGDRPQPGAEDAEFVAEAGRAHVPVSIAASALREAIAWFTSQEALARHPWHRDLVAQAGCLSMQREAPLCWFLDATPDPGPLTAKYRLLTANYGRLVESAINDNWTITELSPAAVMYGALSPSIEPASAVTLIAKLHNAMDVRRRKNRPPAVDDHVEKRPAWAVQSPWDDAYELALSLLDDLDAVTQRRQINIRHILEKLDIEISCDDLGREGPRGAAIAGADFWPTIVVNSAHPSNRTKAGQRFTLAHEFCHILYDRDRARRVTHSSTPWAPSAIEQRANAFAAMFLMPPPLVQRVFQRSSGKVTLNSVGKAARDLNVGVLSAIRHFANIGVITSVERDLLEEELSDQINAY
jgi:Zn-dependent peptidase ImmA (M78 family)